MTRITKLSAKVRECNSYNGDSTCGKQVTPSANPDDHSLLPTGNSWSCQQNNATNANYVTIPSGTVNNNNKNNTYAVVPVAELERLLSLLLDAKDDCWRNKKSRLEAAAFRFHQSEMFDIFDRIISGGYKPGTSVCFVLEYPRYREVFAANYSDRIVHHLVAPFIQSVTEQVHEHNGNISHGNRRGYSAHTAALQIQSYMKEYSDGYVATMDVSGFFMNICREMAYETFVKFCSQFRPVGYSDSEVDMMLGLIYTLIMHDPTSDCERRSPAEMWNCIAKNKTLFGNGGCGLPIGNFYSQLIANLVMSIWGMAILLLRLDCKITQFVDDMCSVSLTVEVQRKVREVSDSALRSISLSLHPNKYYIQPVRHGVGFCGRVIYADRIYIGNRTVRACKNSIRKAIHTGASVDSAKRLMQSYNSYAGLMCHCQSYKIQVELAEMVMASEYSKYLYFVARRGQVVCQMIPEHKDICRSIEDIRLLNKHFKFKLRYMIIKSEHLMVVPAGTPRKQFTQNGVVVRYGYQEMAGSSFFLVAEQTFSEMPPVAELRKIVEQSNRKRGIKEEFNPADYGY